MKQTAVNGLIARVSTIAIAIIKTRIAVVLALEIHHGTDPDCGSDLLHQIAPLFFPLHDPVGIRCKEQTRPGHRSGQE